MDSGDKASNKAQAVAHKYALLQVFCIPTDDLKDPEYDNHELKPITKEPSKPAAPKAEPTYSNTPYSETTIKRVKDCKKNGKIGKECLKSYIADYNKANKTTFVEIADFDDKNINKLIDFIDKIPPQGV
jgi:hypothetical protein